MDRAICTGLQRIYSDPEGKIAPCDREQVIKWLQCGIDKEESASRSLLEKLRQTRYSHTLEPFQRTVERVIFALRNDDSPRHRFTIRTFFADLHSVC